MTTVSKRTSPESCALPDKTETFSRSGELHRWLSRQTDSEPLTTNQPCYDLPFQRWLKFKEAFSPGFVLQCIEKLDYQPQTCLDPFGGSGTTALTCQFLGIRPTTIEVNPFIADIIEAKLCSYHIELLRDDYVAVIKKVSSITDEPERLILGGPPTLCEPGDGTRWIFDKAVFDRVMRFRSAIDQTADTANRRLMKVLLGSLLIDVSNVVVNGKGRRYRGGWKKRMVSPWEVDNRFKARLHQAFEDICRFNNRHCSEYRLLRGDSRHLLAASEPADLVLFSPPYPNSFDYTDIYNVELWTLGYLRNKDDNTGLRKATLRSHVQIKHDYSFPESMLPGLESTVQSLRAARGKLWDRNIPEMVGSYFADLRQILSSLRSKVMDGGAVMMAVGASRYAGITVDTAALLTEMAPSTGFECVEVMPVRSMRSSAQQGGRNDLSETLLWFR